MILVGQSDEGVDVVMQVGGPDGAMTIKVTMSPVTAKEVAHQLSVVADGCKAVEEERRTKP